MVRHCPPQICPIMQFKITLRCMDRYPVIPINYQYELSAWIYKVIEYADTDYAAFLHQRGYSTGKKSFKLFCFSQLEVPRRRIEGDRLHIDSATISFMVSFYVDKTAEEFIRGLFTEQQFALGDRVSRANFRVEMVEMRAFPALSGRATIRTGSPMTVARGKENGYEDYLSPEDPDFQRCFYLNLLDKYTSATGAPPPEAWKPEHFGFKLLTAVPRSQLITIKAAQAAQTRVRGFRFDFEMEAPAELIELGLLAGFGKFNAQGFGFGRVI